MASTVVDDFAAWYLAASLLSLDDLELFHVLLSGAQDLACLTKQFLFDIVWSGLSSYAVVGDLNAHLANLDSLLRIEKIIGFSGCYDEMGVHTIVGRHLRVKREFVSDILCLCDAFGSVNLILLLHLSMEERESILVVLIERHGDGEFWRRRVDVGANQICR